MYLTLNNLKKSFGEKTAVNIPSFTVNSGDILGLVGNNGAGKTTLFRLVLDLLEADEGNVSINGIDPTKDENWKLSTGAFIDDSFLIDFLTPEEYFANQRLQCRKQAEDWNHIGTDKHATDAYS